MCRFNEILIKIPIPLFSEISKTILKVIWTHKILQKSKANVTRSNKNKSGGITLPDSDLQHAATVIKACIMETEYKIRNKIEDTTMSAYNYRHLLSDQKAKNMCQRKKKSPNKQTLVSLTNSAGKTACPHAQWNQTHIYQSAQN